MLSILFTITLYFMTTLGIIIPILALGCRFGGVSLTEARPTPITGWVPMECLRNRRLRPFTKSTAVVWLRALLLSGLTFLVYHFSPMAVQEKAWGWGILFFFIMLAIMVYLTVWWRGNGSRVAELLWLMIALIGVVSATNAAAGLWTLGISSDGWAQFVACVPWGLTAIMLIICVASTARRWRRLHSGTSIARRWTAFAWIFTVLVIAVLVLLLIFSGDILGITGPNPNPPQPNPGTTSSFWGHWYCQNPETKIDEFGPCPDNVESLTGQQAWEEFKKTSANDPLIGISQIYYRDCVTGNRLLVEYYRKYFDDTDAVNGAIWHYSTGSNKSDGSKYAALLDESVAWVEDHNPSYDVYSTKQLREKGIVVSDQLYANVYSHNFDSDGDEIPAAIVYDCGSAENDHYLVVTYRIKFREVREIYHLNCRFQPCNPSEVMRVEVQPKPDPEPDNGNTPSGGSNPSGGSDPTPTTAPTPKPTEKPTPGYNKDPEKAKYDNVEPNDAGSSAGSDTNTGQGSTRSAGQTEQNHGSYDSYKSSYDRTVQDTNAGKGSDSGGGGSGSYAGVDQSKDSGYAADPGTARTSGGGNITNNESNPGGVLGGPPD